MLMCHILIILIATEGTPDGPDVAVRAPASGILLEDTLSTPSTHHVRERARQGAVAAVLACGSGQAPWSPSCFSSARRAAR